LKTHGVNAELVTEYAKDVVWGENFSVLDNQPYILGKHYHRLFLLLGKVVSNCNRFTTPQFYSI